MSDRDDVDPAIAEAVLSYFRRHPQAADGLEGIARWRLLEEIAVPEIETTSQALRWLVARGYLAEERHPGMAPLYRLAPGAPPHDPFDPSAKERGQ